MAQLDPAYIQRLDAKIARLRARLETLNRQQETDTAHSAEAGWDIGGIRTRAGQRSAGRRLDSTISRACEAVDATRELQWLEMQREAYAAGRADKQGRQLPPSGARLQELITAAEDMFIRSTRRDGTPLSVVELDGLKDLLRRYRRLAKKDAKARQ